MKIWTVPASGGSSEAAPTSLENPKILWEDGPFILVCHPALISHDAAQAGRPMRQIREDQSLPVVFYVEAV